MWERFGAVFSEPAKHLLEAMSWGSGGLSLSPLLKGLLELSFFLPLVGEVAFTSEDVLVPFVPTYVEPTGDGPPMELRIPLARAGSCVAYLVVCSLPAGPSTLPGIMAYLSVEGGASHSFVLAPRVAVTIAASGEVPDSLGVAIGPGGAMTVAQGLGSSVGPYAAGRVGVHLSSERVVGKYPLVALSSDVWLDAAKLEGGFGPPGKLR